MPEVDAGFPGKRGRRAGGNKAFSSLVEMAIAPLRASCHRQSSMAKTTAALNSLPGLQKRVREREVEIERLKPSSRASDKQPVMIAALRMTPRIYKEFTRIPLS